MQPVAADDVAAAVADVAVKPPVNAMVELAGPEALSMAAFVGRLPGSKWGQTDDRPDPQSQLLRRALLDSRGLCPGSHARIGPTRFDRVDQPEA